MTELNSIENWSDVQLTDRFHAITEIAHSYGTEDFTKLKKFELELIDESIVILLQSLSRVTKETGFDKRPLECIEEVFDFGNSSAARLIQNRLRDTRIIISRFKQLAPSDEKNTLKQELKARGMI